MSEAVKSDGEVNKLVLGMCDRGFTSFQRPDLDRVLQDHDLLKQCKLETLLRASYQYISVFGDMPLHVLEHVTIKMQQSSKWRDYISKRKHTSASNMSNASVEENTDPLGALLNRQKSKN